MLQGIFVFYQSLSASISSVFSVPVSGVTLSASAERAAATHLSNSSLELQRHNVFSPVAWTWQLIQMM